MNKVVLTGRICNNLELRYTALNQKAVLGFTLATNRPVMRDGERQADFINCVVFGTQAENLHKYQGKGSLIGVEGRIQVRNYDRADGNKAYVTEVVVENIEYLGSKKQDAATEQTTPEKQESNPYADFGQQIAIDPDDLPF